MPQILVSVAISAAISVATGFVARKIASRKASRQDSVLQPAAPRASADNLSASVEVGSAQIGVMGHRRVGGRVVLSAKSGTKTYVVMVVAGAAVSAVNAVYFNNRLVSINGSDQVATGPWAKNGYFSARVKLYTGAQTTVDPWLDAAFPGWTADHVGKQLTYAVIEFDPSVSTANFDSVYQSGVPDITFDVSGFKCYDPRVGGHNIADPTTWSYSANSAIIKANYLIHKLGAALPTSAVDWPSVTAAANICDQAVTLKDGGTEARYTCSAVWNTDERHEDVLARMNATDAGGVHLVGQKWRVYSGGFTASSATVTTADYAGDGLSWAETPPLASLVNGVRGKFCSPLHNFEDRDFPAFQDAAAITADGREAWLDLDLAFVLSHTQAQRLAKIALKKAREGFNATLETKFDFFDIVADDVISITDTLAGFTATTFRVQSEEVQDDFTIRFELEREASTFWDWTPASDEKAFAVSDPLLGEQGNLQPPGAAITGVASGPNCAATLTFWASPSPGVSHHPWSMGANSGEPAANVASVVMATIGTGSNIGNVSFNGKNAVTGENSATVTITSVGTSGATLLTYTVANTPLYSLPPPQAPLVPAIFSGTATLRVGQVPGVRSSHIEIWENTTNNSGTATLISTQSNGVGGISLVVTGTPGTAKFYWARTKNATDSKFSPYSNPALVVF